MLPTVRAALRLYYGARRGPRGARPRWTDTPRDERADNWDIVVIGRALRSPEHCDVRAGSPLDEELRRWALEIDITRTPAVRSIESRLRVLLRSVDVVAPARRHVTRRCTETQTTSLVLGEIDEE